MKYKSIYILAICALIIVLFMKQNTEGFKDASGNAVSDNSIQIVGLIFGILMIVLLLWGNLSNSQKK